MPAQPLTRRARWIGGAFALAVLAIVTPFIRLVSARARPGVTPFDGAWSGVAAGSATAGPRRGVIA